MSAPFASSSVLPSVLHSILIFACRILFIFMSPFSAVVFCCLRILIASMAHTYRTPPGVNNAKQLQILSLSLLLLLGVGVGVGGE